LLPIPLMPGAVVALVAALLVLHHRLLSVEVHPLQPVAVALALPVGLAPAPEGLHHHPPHRLVQ
jgi:hypothetical protein